MKLLIKILLIITSFLFFVGMINAQDTIPVKEYRPEMIVSPGASFGGHGWQTDSVSYENGLNFGFDIFFHKQYSAAYDVSWLAKASFKYTSFSSNNTTSKFLHFRGGFGLTDSENIFFTIAPGYLTSLSRKAYSVPTLDAEILVATPEWINGVQFYISGCLGTTLLNPFPDLDLDAVSYFSGSIGIKYNFYEKSTPNFSNFRPLDYKI